jgi:UDP-N-acetyl-D-glucosamine dehydrogenase
MRQPMVTKFKARINQKKAKIAVIGLGYVGLPLAVEFARRGFKALGVDIDKNKINSINRGNSYILDIPGEEIKPLVKKGSLRATNDYSKLREVDAIIICVPTPLRKTKDPDISFIVSAAEAIAKNIRKGQVIVLESTTYPGTTEEVILPILEATGLKVGKDFCLGFSPERIDPGNPRYMTHNIPKVVSGIKQICKDNIKLLYSQIVGKVIPVSSVKVAEMVKLLENTFRSVNIGLVNELALMWTYGRSSRPRRQSRSASCHSTRVRD